ncbi:hypothetical protein [Ramlibacter alkalitolerans]|uniref:Uncharacterized protein n=1 Tax=Ramlibacter alkalitolerans TaxID=2039631 RepID=A0ABS1JU70_9BURK|nr:hypothetical protein [Ramlibacter alkalitolerans]MBL0427676.1 hypothetical protein [Ramlibacter alkalitolerans]
MNIPYEIYRREGSEQRVLSINAGLLAGKPSFRLMRGRAAKGGKLRLEVRSEHATLVLDDLPKDVATAALRGHAFLAEFNSFGLKAAHGICIPRERTARTDASR